MITGELAMQCNTPDAVREANAVLNRARGVRRFATQPVRDGAVAIVGGGPSLADHLDELRRKQQQGVQIWATNNTFGYLCTRDIYPDAHVLLDARPEMANFITAAAQSTRYYLHESCHPSVFEMLRYADVVIYDLGGEATGTTVGLKALYLAGFSGYRKFHLYGFDSSYRQEAHHAYDQELNDEEKQIEVIVEGQPFRCAPWMLIQAEEFQQIACSFLEQGCTITVAGDGLLPTVARAMMRYDRVLACVWDLQVCPPTYDFGSFLGEAERKRIEIGARYIDLIIQPGPVGGFRDDDLPPNLGAREGMLWRVVVAMARLLPSVRNIDVRKVRGPVSGTDLFPDDYTVARPTYCYGHALFGKAAPILEASTAARAWIRKKHPYPYMTITTREATHWAIRNSNLDAWNEIQDWLEEQGYECVWVADTESENANCFSWDLDLRVALYEGAVLNLGVNNGPMMIVAYCHAEFLIFKMVTESIPWCTAEFHAKWGTPKGDHASGNGRLIWENDDVHVIRREVTAYLKERGTA